MPELAEVEYVARQMRATLIGATITGVVVSFAKTIQTPDPDSFSTMLIGRTIHAVDRRAKILLIHLDASWTLAVHRRMSGNVRLLESDQPDEPYERVRLLLDDGRRLLYTDPRKFGRLALVQQADLQTMLADLGPEPLAVTFTVDALTNILAHSQRAIKALLLDQNAIAGLGNIYADEALYAARIHPLRPASSLTADEVARLHDAIVAVLELGIVHGGTTFGRHQGLFGEAGTNLDHIKAYKHTGQPCERCGTPMQRIVVAQRGTHFCPTCQPDPHLPLHRSEIVTMSHETNRTQLYLIRHGEAITNVEPIVGGMNGDKGLTPLGIMQAEALRDRLMATNEIQPDVFIVSPLARARQTATIISAAFTVPMIFDEDVQELMVGEADGMHVSEFRAKYGLPDFEVEPWRPIAPGGENWPMFVMRVARTLHRITSEHRGKTILIVCHGGFIDNAMLILQGHANLMIPPFDFATYNTSITQWDYREDERGKRWRMVRYNDAGHIHSIGRNPHIHWRDIPPQPAEEHTSVPLPTEPDEIEI